MTLLWLTTLEKEIHASLNCCKKMKEESSRQNLHKLATKLELVVLLATYIETE